jgi:putative aldouronate transport system permease protein
MDLLSVSIPNTHFFKGGKRMKIKKLRSTIAFEIFGYVVITAVALLCVFPIILIISGSVTDNEVLIRGGYRLIPAKFNFEAYGYLLRYPEGIVASYGNTIAVTVIGTCIGILVITMTGYVLQRPDFKYRRKISFLIYFTTLFGGGLIPWFILISKYLHMSNSYMARIFPLLMSPFLIILMRTFISSTVPNEVVESAKIDGAGDFLIYRRIVMPIIGPGIATVALFLALSYWNDWYLTSLFITKKSMFSLQYYLYDMLNSARFAQDMGMTATNAQLPSESIKMAMVVVVTGPIILLYPFVQRYFVSGITIGSVKG